jgi:hypothetical protein
MYLSVIFTLFLGIRTYEQYHPVFEYALIIRKVLD